MWSGGRRRRRDERGTLDARAGFSEDLVQETKLGGDEGCRVLVTGPAGYVYAVEGLVEKVAEGYEGLEKDGVGGR